MSYLEPKNLEEQPKYLTGGGGTGTIQRFESKKFGGTFARIVRTDIFTFTVEQNPETGYGRVRASIPRMRDKVMYGRICTYPASGTAYWKSLSEEEPYSDPFGQGSTPYVSYRYDGYFLEFVDPKDSPAIGTKVVVQLLHCEL